MKKLFIIMLVFYACSPKQDIKLSQLNWIKGTWMMQGKEGIFIEHWEADTDSSLKGKGFFISKEKDTGFSEQLWMVNRNDTLFYKTITVHNGIQPVYFTETKFNEDEIIFENPYHDFPQKIHYTKINKDSLVITVSGMEDGNQRKEQFFLKRKY